MNVYESLNNRAVRVVVALLMVVCLTVVPFDFKIQEAKTAYAVAITGGVAITILVGVLIGCFGFQVARNYVSAIQGNYYDAKAGYYTNNGSPRYAGTQNLWTLAQDILDNVVEVAQWANANRDVAKKGVVGLLNVPKYIYTAIKNYLDGKYTSESGSISEGVENASGLLTVPNTILFQGYYCYPWTYVTNGQYMQYDFTTYDVELVNLSCTSNEGVYKTCNYTFTYGVTASTDGKFTVNVIGIDSTGNKSAWNGSYTIDSAPHPELLITYQPSAINDVGNYVRVYIVDGGRVQRIFDGANMTWLEGEYEMAVQSIAGQTGLSVDEDVYNNIDNYAPYVKVYDDVLEYEDKTREDIASYTAVTADTESNIVNASAQTLTWTGEIEDCPIDDLEASLVALGLGAAIGNWALKWADDSTMCDISCTDITTGETSVSISSDVTMTWADVLEKVGVNTDVGTDTETGTGSGTIAGEATLDMPKTSIDWTPLQLAGSIYTSRFPFSLPWDMYNAFTFFFREEKTDKVIIIPLDMGVLGEHDLVLDLTPIFDNRIIMVSRYGFYVLFVLGLILATNKLIGRG